MEVYITGEFLLSYKQWCTMNFLCWLEMWCWLLDFASPGFSVHLGSCFQCYKCQRLLLSKKWTKEGSANSLLIMFWVLFIYFFLGFYFIYYFFLNFKIFNSYMLNLNLILLWRAVKDVWTLWGLRRSKNQGTPRSSLEWEVLPSTYRQLCQVRPVASLFPPHLHTFSLPWSLRPCTHGPPRLS